MSRQETLSGFIYLTFQFIFLPAVLNWCCSQFSLTPSDAELNFTYYLINFIAMLLIFHDFLSRSLTQVFRHPGIFLEGIILGAVAYYACFHGIQWLIRLLVPGFSNHNDASIAALGNGNPFLMLVGTVILVPPAEECMFRGLIFRNLYGKSRWGAYVVSILAFAVIHIIGYIGLYSPLEILMAFLQYLPAGLCLAWSYVRSDSIFAPILIHAAVNYITIQSLR